MTISVSAISTTWWSLDQDLEFYAEAGITAAGISQRKLEAHRGGWDDALAKVRASGLPAFTLHDRSEWRAQQDRLLRGVEAAAAVKAECILTTTGPAGSLTWEQAADAYALAAEPARAAARRVRIPWAVEHTHALRADVGFVHSLRDAVHLAEQLDISVGLEVQACWTERALEQTITDHIARIAVVQVSDYVVGTHSTPDRVVPGDGDIPLERILRTLVSAGYTGAFDIELIGPRIETEGYEQAITRSVRHVERLLREIGATTWT
jgi:sugar phosphate isomerase/epimerase